MPSITTGSTSIGYGSTLRIGYRVYGSISGFTYITHYATYDELPYSFTVPSSGVYEIEYTEVCPTCSSPTYSQSVQTIVTVP